MNYLVHPRRGGDEAKISPTPGVRLRDDDFLMMSIAVPTFCDSFNERKTKIKIVS